MLLGYRFELRPNSHALVTAGSVMTIDLSFKRMLAHRLTDFSDFKGVTGYRKSLIFSAPLARSKTERGRVRWVDAIKLFST